MAVSVPVPISVLSRLFFILPFSGDWSHREKELWPLKYPECAGYRQSPLALNSFYSYIHNHVHLHFYNYGIPLSTPIELMNNGYTADVDIKTTEDNNIPYVTINGLHDYFEIQGLHFHWGSQTSAGSEHTIDGKQFDLEMHIVHKNSKYSTVEQARNYPDGFLVLGVLFKTVPYLESSHHSTLRETFDALDSITKYNTSTELNGKMTLGSFLPDVDINKFFTYQGSLTTPPCSESVFWFVFQDIVPILYEDLKKFWNLLDKNGDPLVNNFREVQKSVSPVYRKSYKYYEF